MVVIWLGAAFVCGGMLFLAFQAIWRGQLSESRRSRSAGATLEPAARGAGGVFGLKANWPGLVLIGLGAILLLAGAAF